MELFQKKYDGYRSRIKRTASFLGAACMIVAISGCGVLKPIDGGPSADIKTNRRTFPSPAYYDFDDVLIPGDIRVNRKMSAVSKTENVVAGVLALSGQMEVSELITFFTLNMGKDNWSFVNMVKGSRSILLFEKESRWCIITLSDRRYDYQTKVEVWVTPKSKQAASGLLK